MKKFTGIFGGRRLIGVMTIGLVATCSVALFGGEPGAHTKGVVVQKGVPAGAEIPVAPPVHAQRLDTVLFQEGAQFPGTTPLGGAVASGVCDEDVDCDDCSTCTVDECVFEGGGFTGTCTNTPRALCDICGNDNFCDGQEICDDAGDCRPAATLPCSSDPAVICDENAAQAGEDPCVPPCNVDADCTDTVFCNGTEVCALQECVGGTNAGASCSANGDCDSDKCGGICISVDPPCGSTSSCDEDTQECLINGRCCIPDAGELSGFACSRTTNDNCGGNWLNVGDVAATPLPLDEANCVDLAPPSASNAGEDFGCPAYGAGIAPTGAFGDAIGQVGHAVCAELSDLGDDYAAEDSGPGGANENKFIEVTTIRWVGGFQSIGIQDSASRYLIQFYDNESPPNLIEETITNPVFGGEIARRTVIFGEKPVIPARGWVVLAPAPKFSPFARQTWMTTDATDIGDNNPLSIWTGGGPQLTADFFPGTSGVLAIEIIGDIVNEPLGACCVTETGECEQTLPWICERDGGFFQGVGVFCQTCANDSFTECEFDTDCGACEGASDPGLACSTDSECPDGICDAGICLGGGRNGQGCDLNIDCQGDDTCTGTASCQPVPPACALSACCIQTAGVAICQGGRNPGDCCPTGTECDLGTCTGVSEGAGECCTVREAFCSVGGNPCFGDSDCAGGPDTCEAPCPSGTVSNGFGTSCEPNCCEQPLSGYDTCVEAAAGANKVLIEIPLPGEPPVTITFSSNNTSATFGDNNNDSPTECETSGLPCETDADCDPEEACVTTGTCSFGIFSSAGGTKDRGWWHSFTTTACADIRVDFCCTETRSGEPHKPQWAALWNSCDPCTTTLGSSVIGPPVGTATAAGDRGLPFCVGGDDLWQTYGPVPAGVYWVPAFSAPGGHFGDYQLHVTAAACPLAACCLPGSFCVDGSQALVTDGGGAPIACGDQTPCASGTCEFCALVNEPDCDDVGGFWNGLSNLPSGASPITDCSLGGDSPCDLGSCCQGPGDCTDNSSGVCDPTEDPPDPDCCDPNQPLTCMNRSLCEDILTGLFRGGARCDFPEPPCPTCTIQTSTNCQLPMPESFGGGSGSISDLTIPPHGTVSADDFIPQGSVLSSVCVWGFYHDPTLTGDDEFGCINAVEDEFRIRVFEDNNGIPGALIGESLSTGANVARGVQTGTGFIALYGDNTNASAIGHTLTLDTAIAGMNPGEVHWLEVANNTRGATDAAQTCWWNWLNALPTTNDDGYSAAGGNSGGTDDPKDYLFAASRYIHGSGRPHDLAFCLGTTGGVPLPFEPGTELKAACWTCAADGDPACTLETQLNCSDNTGIGGVWNRLDISCGGTVDDIADLLDGDVCAGGAAGAIASFGGGVCGNNILEDDEQCDDGNTTPGDGCDEDCNLECPEAPLPTGTCDGGDTPGAECEGDGDCLPDGTCVFSGGARVITAGLHAFNTNCTVTDGSESLPTSDAGTIGVGNDVWFYYTTTCTGKLHVNACPTQNGLTEDFYITVDNAVGIYHDPDNPTECLCPGTSNQFLIQPGSDEGCNGIADAGPGRLSRIVGPGECYTVRMTNFGGTTATAGRGPSLLDIDCITSDCPPSVPPRTVTLEDEFGTVSENRKSRMLPVLVDDPGLHAIRVKFVDLPPPYDIWNFEFTGTYMWATAPQTVCGTGSRGAPLPDDPGGPCVHPTYTTSLLKCGDPVFVDWNKLGEINLWGEGVIPNAVYEIQVMHPDCNPTAEASFSDPLVQRSAIYGDVVKGCASTPCSPVDDLVNIIDPFQGINTFQTANPAKISKSRTDAGPGECIDGKAGIGDVLDSIRAFSGEKYNRSPRDPDPCSQAATCTQFTP